MKKYVLVTEYSHPITGEIFAYDLRDVETEDMVTVNIIDYMKMKENSDISIDEDVAIESTDNYRLKTNIRDKFEQSHTRKSGEVTFRAVTSDSLDIVCKRQLRNVTGKRDIFERIYDKVTNPSIPRRVLMTNGLRRTGKTVIMLQLIQELVKRGMCNYEDISYVEILSDALNADQFFKLIESLGPSKYKYVFIDEISKVSGINSFSQYISDMYNDTQFFLTGTYSYTIFSMYRGDLATRSTLFDLPPVTYREYCNLIKPISHMEFMRIGGIFTEEFNNPRDAKGYILTAVVENIANSATNSNMYKGLNPEKYDIEVVNAVVNKILYSSLKSVSDRMIRETFEPNFSTGGIIKLSDNVKKEIERELDKYLAIKIPEDGKYNLKDIREALIDTGVICDVVNIITGTTRHTLTRFTGLMYNVCNLISNPRFIEKVFPELDKGEMKELIDNYTNSIQGIVLESLITSELITHFSPYSFRYTEDVDICTLNYSNKVEVDLMLLNSRNFDDPREPVIKDNVYIEIKRDKFYRPSHVRWLVDKSLKNGDEIIRMMLYNGKSCKLDVAKDENIINMKLKDEGKYVNTASRDRIELGLNKNVKHVYLVNIGEFLLDIDKHLKKTYLDTLPDHNFTTHNKDESVGKNKLSFEK